VNFTLLDTCQQRVNANRIPATAAASIVLPQLSREPHTEEACAEVISFDLGPASWLSGR
jgi:hypothetical protein